MYLCSVILWFVCFFFKQKTAYEMRISDWSSDVCSSDLNKKWLDANPLPPEFARFGAFNLLREKSTSDVMALIDDLVNKDAASLSADEKRKIGRASWRERVCQYV